MSENAADIVPIEKRKLRACLLCGLIKVNIKKKIQLCEISSKLDVLHWEVELIIYNTIYF